MMRAALAVAALAAAFAVAAEEVQVAADSAQHIESEGRTVFSGDVAVSGGGFSLQADELAVTGTDAPIYEASGSPATAEVRQDNGATVTMSAPMIRYDSGGALRLSGGATLSGDGRSIKAQRIDANQSSREIVAHGKVRLEQGGMVAEGDRLELANNGREGKVTGAPAQLSRGGDEPLRAQAARLLMLEDGDLLHLEGDAVAERGGGTIRGERIVYRVGDGTLRAEGKDGERVRAVIGGGDG